VGTPPFSVTREHLDTSRSRSSEVMQYAFISTMTGERWGGARVGAANQPQEIGRKFVLRIQFLSAIGHADAADGRMIPM
jgi:hypothetical protein